MRAIVVNDMEAGVEGMQFTEHPHPHAAENDVIVRVRASGFTPGELTWPGTWADRSGKDRTPSVPGHEVAGVVDELGYGTTGLSVGQRVVGFADWSRDGSLAEFVAVEARNLVPLPADIDFVTAASLPISGLTAWQALFVHAQLEAGQSVLILGAAGGVGSVAVQLAREVGAYVVGAGRAQDRETILGLGAHEFVDLGDAGWTSRDEVDVVFDVIGGEIAEESSRLVRAGGVLVTIAEPPAHRPAQARSVFFVVEPDRAQLGEIIQRVRGGRLRIAIGTVAPLEDAAAAFSSHARVHGKTIISVGD